MAHDTVGVEVAGVEAGGWVDRLAPEAAAAWRRSGAEAAAVVDARMLGLCRLRVVELLGDRADGDRRRAEAVAGGLDPGEVAVVSQWYRADAFGPAERAALAFTEQFVADVSSVSPRETAPLLEALGPEGCYAFISALFVAEFSERLALSVERVLGASATAGAAVPSSTARPAVRTAGADHRDLRLPLPAGAAKPSARAAAYAPGVHAALSDFQAAAVRLDAVDAVVGELVRLRCARHHDCRVCRTLRLDGARREGVDEAMLAKLDVYDDSDLPERAKAALRFTDAFITVPSLIDAGLRDELVAAYRPAEIVELALDIMKFSTQKILVSLGLDIPPEQTDELGVAYFDFGPDGRPAWFSAVAP